MTYVNVEPLLAAWLTATVSTPAVLELPADLATHVPLIHVVRIGGADASLTLDHANVDVEFFAADRSAAYAGAESVRHALRFVLPGLLLGTAPVQFVRTISAPSWRPWDDTNVRRVGALYEITVHHN